MCSRPFGYVEVPLGHKTLVNCVTNRAAWLAILGGLDVFDMSSNVGRRLVMMSRKVLRYHPQRPGKTGTEAA
jgi:hypothetical protein